MNFFPVGALSLPETLLPREADFEGSLPYPPAEGLERSFSVEEQRPTAYTLGGVTLQVVLF